jgi:hypothetical protein
VENHPIRDVALLDLLGERVDGGLDMGIVAEGPVDGSTETLARLERKVRNYLAEALDESFRSEFGVRGPDKITIRFESKFPVDAAARDLLASLARKAKVSGITLLVKVK